MFIYLQLAEFVKDEVKLRDHSRDYGRGVLRQDFANSATARRVAAPMAAPQQMYKHKVS